jgi:hypothetical protein
MILKTKLRRMRTFLSIGLAVTAAAGILFADHSWGNYHWARSQNPFTVNLGDNVTSTWDAYLSDASLDWTVSSVLDAPIVPGGSTTARKCSPTSGRVEVCDASYGGNGWLGIAQIWVSGDHIVQGTVKLNDFYFDSSLYSYNTPAWRRLVTCQEVGHTFGLDHQDEDFNNPNLGTCMDYTSDPTTNQHPNAHDYEELETIYAHLDSGGTSGGGGGGGGKGKNGNGTLPPAFTGLELTGPGQWGRSVALSNNGLHETFEADFGGGNVVITFVTWVNGAERGRALNQ